MRHPIHALLARQTWAHLAYTSVFERVNVTAVSATAVYGALTAVEGASGTVTISLPNFTTPAVEAKMCFDCGIVNADGAHSVTISAADGKTINGASSVSLPSSAGAFAWCFFDEKNSEWVAIMSTAGDNTPPPTYTSRGPGSAPFSITGTPTAIPQTSITTAAFSSSQKAIITFSVEVTTAAGTQDDNTFVIFDGVVGSVIDTFIQTCGNSGVDASPEHNVISWTLEELGNGSTRTFGIGVSGANPGNCTVGINKCRGVVQIVDG